jgi:hypothetical protein
MDMEEPYFCIKLLFFFSKETRKLSWFLWSKVTLYTTEEFSAWKTAPVFFLQTDLLTVLIMMLWENCSCNVTFPSIEHLCTYCSGQKTPDSS